MRCPKKCSKALLLVVTLALPATAQVVFGPVQTSPMGAPHPMEAFADLDLDGDTDAVALDPAGFVALYRNVFPSDLQVAGFVPVVPQPLGVAVGDLDEDGDVDLVTTSATPKVVTLLFVSGSSFTRVDFGVSTVGPPTVLDGNGDGHLDIILGRESLLAGDGQGGFAPPQPFVSPDPIPSDAVPTDVNGDGHVDFVYHVLSPSPLLRMAINDGSCSFAYSDIASGTGPNPKVGVGDFDGDGDDDVVLVDETSNLAQPESFTIRIFRQDVSGFAAPTTVTASLQPFGNFGLGAVFPFSVQTFDVDADGFDDLVLRMIGFGFPSQETHLVVFRGDVALSLPQALDAQAPFDTSSMRIADMTNDGFPDLVRVGPAPTDPLTGIHEIAVNLTNPNPSFLYQITSLSPMGHAGYVQQGFIQPILWKLEDAGGQGVPGVDVTFTTPNGPVVVTTDTNGIARQFEAPSTSSGMVVAQAGATNAAPGMLDVFLRETNGQVLNPASTVRTLEVTYLHERPGIPLWVAVDLPRTPEVTYAGTLHTSLLMPEPELGLLPVLGGTQPFMGGFLTTVQAMYSAFVFGGTSVVVQVYGYDAALGFPQNLIVSDPVFLTL